MKATLYLIILLFSFGSVCAQDIITNTIVIEMSKAGIPVAVIITKIKNSKVNFDTTIPALKELAGAGVADQIVSVMIETQSSQAITKPTLPELANGLKGSQHSRPPSPTFVSFIDLDSDGQKRRLKEPALVEISASSLDVMALLVRSFQSWSYQIENEDARSLLLSKPVSGVGNKFLVGLAIGGNNMRYKIQVSVAEYQNISRVSVSAWVTSDNAFGKTTQESMNTNKKWRIELDGLLRSVKNEAERKIPSETDKTEPIESSTTSVATSLINPDGFPVRWKSLLSGTIRRLRKDGDYIYFESEGTEEQISMGMINRGEVRKNGEVYIGKSSIPYWSWYKTNPTTGKKYSEKVCREDETLELKIVSFSRIEVKGSSYPDGTKFDKNCKPKTLKKPEFTTVWIPVQ